MLTKGAHKFKKKDIIINTTGDGPTLKGDSVPASSIVAFPEVFNDNLLSYPNTKVRNTGSPKKKLQEPTPWSPTCEKDGNEKPSALSVLKPADTCLLVQVKESHRLDNCVKDPTTLSTPISSSPRTRDSPGKKHKTSSNRTRKHATLKETQPPKTEWLISFSTLDNDASVLPKLPYQISNSNSVRPLSAQCSRRTSLVSLTSSRSSSPICNPSRKCTPLRPYSACLKKASMVQELKLKSSPSLSLNSQSVPFSSLTFEAKGFYSVKSRRQEHLSKELAIIQVNPTQREISKLSGVWKSLKTLAWKDTKKKDDLNLLNNSQYCNYQTALVPVSKSKSIIPAQSFTDARLFSKLETTSVVKSQTSTVIDHELEVADDTKWREPNQSSDSEDSDVDAHSDVCESLESLVDHGIDSDVSISTEGSDDSDDESIDLNDEVKTFEERVIGDGTSISSPGVSNAISDDFTTISPTRDYYPVKEDSPIGTIGQMYPWLRFSLFPNIPPTINFRVMDSPPLNIPPEVKRILKWKSTAVTPAIIRRVLYNSGMRIVKRSRQWIGIWSKHMRANLFKTIKDFQKFNHFPGTFQIGRKDTLWRNHVRLRNIHGKKSYDFLPVTYVIPSDMKQLRHAWEKSSPNQMWIIKPPASARGSGIKIIHKFMQIPKIRPLIVQKYLSSPFLINGVKFDLRIYVYITSFYPLRIYVYKEGLVRFASVMYSSCPRTVSDRYMHLTNYSVNRKSVTYTANEDVNACKGHKWSLKALWGYLTEKGYDTTAIWNSIVDIVIKTIISCETTVSTLTRLNLKNANSSHELFGFDIILDSNLKPWLLEVNISPSLQSTSKLDASIKGQMCKDLLNLSGVNIPPHLEKSYQQSFLDKVCLDAGSEIESLCFDKRLYRSTLTAEERTKQIAFSRLERHEYLPTVLQNLLPDDIRHLVIAEDERSRAGQYIRVYPTITSHRYHKYFDRPRYYNHLFDAWEMQYANCRMEGIQRLVAACKNGLHVKAVVKESTKVSSPRTDVGRLSSTTSLRVRCCSRSATNRAIQRACRSARNLFARMRITRHCPASKKDLEDAAKSSHTGSGDHLLRSKASDKETEESSLRQTPVSPNSATPSDGLEEPYDGLSQQNKSSKDSKASVPNGNFDHPFKQPNYYTIKDHQLNLQNRGNDGATGMSATNVNGIRVPHCRGCALLSQNYRANILKKSVQEYNNAMEKDPKLDSAPVHHNSLVKSTYNQQTKTTAYTGHVGVDSN